VANLINEAREFSAQELFFSTTDLKGHIQRANKVFQRIAGYSWDALNNKPHNIIRHPDMPRIVFQLLWDYIQSGRPIVAYVKNLAHDGRYYWVVALVVAIPGGYLSVRFKPTSPLLATVANLYTELRAAEASIESHSNSRKAAIAASRDSLDTNLRTLGFRDYDDFMQHAFKRELQSREAAIQRRSTAAGMFDHLVEVLQMLFDDLDVYVEFNKGVKEKSKSVTGASEALRVSALNGAIEADKLGVRAAGLRPVLDWLRELSVGITKEGVRLSKSLDSLVAEVDLVVFSLGAAKLQIEMSAQFADELSNDASGGLGDDVMGMTEGAIRIMHTSSSRTVRQAFEGLGAIRDRLKTLKESQIKLLESSQSLRPIYLTGRIEMTDVAGSRLASVFDDLGSQLDRTAANLTGLKTLLEDLDTHLVRGLAHRAPVEATIAGIDRRLDYTGDDVGSRQK
jgi:aerotaxis receptor